MTAGIYFFKTSFISLQHDRDSFLLLYVAVAIPFCPFLSLLMDILGCFQAFSVVTNNAVINNLVLVSWCTLTRGPYVSRSRIDESALIGDAEGCPISTALHLSGLLIFANHMSLKLCLIGVLISIFFIINELSISECLLIFGFFPL